MGKLSTIIKNFFRKQDTNNHVFMVAYRPSVDSMLIEPRGIFQTWEGAVAEQKRQTEIMGGMVDYEIIQYALHRDKGRL